MFDSGAGYITSPGNVGSPNIGVSQDEKSKESARSKYILPCLISHVHEMMESEGSSESKYDDGLPFIEIIGKVLSVEETSTSRTYAIDDLSSSPINAKIWAIDDDDQTINNGVNEGQHVRIVGKIQGIKGKAFLLIYHISPIKSYNQVTVHTLKIVKSRLKRAEINKVGPNMGTGGKFNSNNTSVNASGVPGFNDNVGGLEGMDKTQKDVYKVIHTVSFADNRSEDGCSLDHIMQTLKTTSKDAIRKAITFLSGEGHIFTTIDDDHFNATESGYDV